MPIENAIVYTTGYLYADQLTNSNGEFSIDVRFGYDYHVTAYANGYELNEITGINVLQNNPVATVNISLNPINHQYIIKNLLPNPNPDISTIMQCGTIHRYYYVENINTLNPGYDIEVEVKHGNDISIFHSNQQGIVDIHSNSSTIGNGHPGVSENYSIISVNGTPLDSTIDFTCKVLNPVYEKYWNSNQFGKLGVSFLSIDFEKGSSTKLIENDANTQKAEYINITRQARAGVGVNFSVGIGAGVQCGDIQAGANASSGVGGSISGITEDYYNFNHNIINNSEALAQYILIADGNFNNLDNTLIRFLSLLEDYFTDQTTLKNVYLGDKKGIDVCASASASANIGIQVNHLLGIGADANIGTEGHALLNIIYHKTTNENEYNFGVSGTYSLSSSAGLSMNIPLYDNWSIGLGNKINIFDYDGTRGMQFSVFKNNNTNLFTKFELKFLQRKDYQGWEEVLTYTISGDGVYDAINSINNQVQILCNPSTASSNINISNNLFSELTNSIFKILFDLQNNDQGDATISYTKERKNITDLNSFNINIGISLTSAVSTEIGGGSGFEEGKSKLIESGKWRLGNHLVLEEYNKNIPDISEEYQEVLQEIIDKIPLSIRFLIGVINWFTPDSKGDSTFFILDSSGVDTTAYIIFPEGTIPSGMDSIFSTSWSWYGNSPNKKLSNLSGSKKKIYSKNRKRAEESFGMKYGIGGFYQIEPLDTALLDTVYFTIFYPDTINYEFEESFLRMYKEDKNNHEWIYIGGIVDTINNSVTAPITELALYTIAPRLPFGEFGLNPYPNSIYADSISTMTIISETIYNNNLTSIVDGELFTVNTEMGEIITNDADSSIDGIQIEAQNGIIEFKLKSSNIACITKVSAISIDGSAKAYTYVKFYDTIPPAKPMNLTANEDIESVYLFWSPNQENDISGYKIYFGSDDSIPPFEGIATVYGFNSPIVIGVDTFSIVQGLFEDSTYYFAITAYDVSGNESDYSVPISASPIKTYPDLIVLNERISKTIIPANSKALISYRIRNQGNDDVGLNILKYYLSKDINFDTSNIYLGSKEIQYITKKYNVSVIDTVDIPPDLSCDTAYILLFADADSNVIEINETNNISYLEIMVTSNPPPYINLGNDTTIYTDETITLDAGSGYSSYLWNNDNTNQTLTIDGTVIGEGSYTYYVIVMDNNGCSNSDTLLITVESGTGIEVIISHAIVKLYPNPSDGMFYLKVKKNTKKELLVEITDLNGKAVYIENFKGIQGETVKQIDFTGQSKGIYFVRILSENRITVEKIIIQ